ncbi:MAG: HAD family hydrolase [Anaerolinea sp.]|nr:HAD family hydrolase [Anaerolinea sp.]
MTQTYDKSYWWHTMTGKDKHIEHIAGILFDWDLTLAKPTGNISLSERLTMLFQRGGFPCTNEAVVKAIAAYRDRTAQEKNTAVPIVPQTQREIIAYYRQLLAHIGYTDLSWERIAALYHDYAYLPTSLYDDVLPTLRKLQKTGLALGIISNHTPAARGIMQSYLGRFIQPGHIIISDEVGVHKPMSPVFIQAAAALNVLPQQCLFVGDNLHVDAIGAVHEGGYRLGLWLDRQHDAWDEPLPPGIIRITSLTQVLDFLED